MDSTHDPSLPTKKVKWDEEVIQEHDKERGTRTKIDEPKTPFRYASESDSEIDENNRICSIDLNEYLMHEMKKQEFKDKRKKHYDEFIRIKRMKQDHTLISDAPEFQDQEESQSNQSDSEVSKSSSESDSGISSSVKSGSSSQRTPVSHSRSDVPLKPSLKHRSV